VGDGQDERFRNLPSIDRVVGALSLNEPAAVVAAAARRAVDLARDAIRSGADAPTLDEVLEQTRGILHGRKQRRLTRVINATGVLLHTNLGRAPLGPEQLDAVRNIASGYSNLEFDLTTGRRGSRYHHAADLIAEATGAEAALVVNNNAAGVLLSLATLCKGREVVISRGELVEIGGEFRIPQVMSAAGVKLVEVGTTNRTHLADYERAITADTAAIFKVHPSNYRVVGFASSVAAADLSRLARGREVLFLHDIGSGLLRAPDGTPWTAEEPTVETSLAEGADLVMFSGDKLLGGPQAGIIVGRESLIASLSKNPLLRALRVDKMTLAALEATLVAYSKDGPAALPLWRMALADPEDLERRATELAERIQGRASDGVKVEATASEAVAGGGSSPGGAIPSWAVAVEHPERSAAELERTLRDSAPPVIARVSDDRLLLDLRTVDPADDALLFEACVAALH
jgi:L-seryl-tRNA(Ser) seleniumtransferase